MDVDGITRLASDSAESSCPWRNKGNRGDAEFLGDKKTSDHAHVDFACAVWFALLNQCAHHAAGLAHCLSIGFENCRPVPLDITVIV